MGGTCATCTGAGGALCAKLIICVCTIHKSQRYYIVELGSNLREAELTIITWVSS